MSQTKPVVLYVDDDQSCLDAVRLVLEANGYAMEEAHSAEEGLCRVRESEPDFVIVDLMMEEVDAGTQFVRELRAEGRQLPVWLLSSVGDEVSAQASAAQLGFDGLLQKPIEPRVLLGTLRVCLGVLGG